MQLFNPSINILSPLKAVFLHETNIEASISLYKYFLALFLYFLVVFAMRTLTFLSHATFVFTDCAGCGRDIKNGQALLALDRQWHLGCFKCKACSKVLTGEYISK